MHDSSDDRPDGHFLHVYFRTIRKLRVLSREEEQVLGKRKEQGDKEAEEQLIEGNVRFVVHLAMKFTNDPQLLLELIQEGNIALRLAVKRFDYRRNLRVSTYAAKWIRWAIVRAMPIPPSMHKKIATLDKIRDRFGQQHGRWPTREEVAQLGGWRPEEVEEIERVQAAHYTPLGWDESAESQGPTAPSAEEQAIQAQEKRQVREALDGLAPQDAAILKRHYLNEEPFPIIDRDYGKKPGWAKKVAQRALPRLRWRLEHDGSA